MVQILILKERTIQSLAGANRAVIRTMDFLIAWFFGWEKSHVLCKNNSIRKIANDRNTR